MDLTTKSPKRKVRRGPQMVLSNFLAYLILAPKGVLILVLPIYKKWHKLTRTHMEEGPYFDPFFHIQDGREVFS